MIHFKQSPINIESTKSEPVNRHVEFHYQVEQFHVFDNGQNISLMPTNGQSYVIKNGKQFHLSEMHFHRPSEHHVDHKEFDMEVHLVHQEDHETVVYSVLLTITNDGYDFGQPFNNLNSNITIDLPTLVPTTCWDYHGSFTTSPFNEVVIWLINHDVQTIASDQAELINSYYPNNNRCLQPTNDRLVHTVTICNH